jgi:hypothetical protein
MVVADDDGDGGAERLTWLMFLQMETEGELRFEYRLEETTSDKKNGNGLLFLVNGELTGMLYRPTSGEWHTYSRFLPPGHSLLTWSYHQDNGAAGSHRVRAQTCTSGLI